jgi:hypothetical protein
MATAAPENVARLMADYRQGSAQAARQLVEMFYPELKHLATSRMREEWRPHTLQPTALVNEL